MLTSSHSSDAAELFKSLGLPNVTIHHAFGHFDFTKSARRILVIGPMGSGKTEYSARVWRDARIALQKSSTFSQKTCTKLADRRQVFFIRSLLDSDRFPDYPPDALAYRGGYELLGGQIAKIRDSFELEQILEDNPQVGTWIIDEASFYDERIAYVVRKESLENGKVFIFPTLILNFRKDIFNPTARLLLETATDVFPLTAYCEHQDCMEDSFYTYRYYSVQGRECPALYFDPLIIVGGDRIKEDPRQPNYATRCDQHHYLPGKEYTYLHLKPLGMEAAKGNIVPLLGELRMLHEHIESSALWNHFQEKYTKLSSETAETNLNSLLVPCIAEKALLYLYIEQNLISNEKLLQLAEDLELDLDYMIQLAKDNGRPIYLSNKLQVT